MSKTHFNNGDLVSGKKWNGEHLLGVYVSKYDCGDHKITDGEKEFCIHKGELKHANEEESKTIQETIVKPMKEKTKKKTKKEIKQEEETETEIAIAEEE